MEERFNLSHPIFTDPDAAREHLEKQRWPAGPVCPHCGATSEHVRAITGARAMPSRSHPEGAERRGLYQCNACRQQFTATVKTIFERSKIPLNKWLAATYLMSVSKKGVSAHQIHRTLGVTYKTAWFMLHRIREAMGEGAAFVDRIKAATSAQSGSSPARAKTPRRKPASAKK